ncbi:MAG TPA: hypothetical protein VGG58_06575 [Candidatus Acidoferrum sp.]|jgi:hypothetical protein
MKDFVGPFDVPSKLTDQAYHVEFSHLWNAITTRHSDTVDSKFFVDGRGVVVGVAHTGLTDFRERAAREVTDREISFIAAEYLRERLEQEDERPIYDVSRNDVLRLIEKIGLR